MPIEASKRTPEDDAMIRQLRVAAGALACADGSPAPAAADAAEAGDPTAVAERRRAIMSEKAQTVQDVFLTHLRERKTPVTIFLMNGIKLQGIVDWFDKFSVVLRRDRHSQLLYKHTISTIMPMAPVQLLDGERSPQQTQALDATAGYRRSMRS